MRENKRLKASRAGDWAPWVVFALFMALCYAVFYALMGRPGSDISIHTTWAAEASFLRPRSFVNHHAHPLWHFLARALMGVGVGFEAAGALATLFWKAAEFWVAYYVARGQLGQNATPWQTALVTVCLMLVSSICVPWINPTVYVGAGTPNTWHSPTQIAVMPFMLAVIPMVARSYDRFAASPAATYREPWGSWALLTALLALSVLAKPVFLQAFLPAACLFFLLGWVRRPQGSRYFCQMTAAVLPSVLLMGLQFYFYFLNPNAHTGMTVQLTWTKLANGLTGLVLLEAFPLFALLTQRKRARDTLYTLTLWLGAAAFLERVLLSELGQRSGDGNFGWAMYGAALMLWTLMLPRFINQFSQWRKSAARVGAWRYGVGFALLGYHLVSGVYYVLYLLATTYAL